MRSRRWKVTLMSRGVNVTLAATIARFVTRVTDGIVTVTDRRQLHVISDYVSVIIGNNETQWV